VPRRGKARAKVAVARKLLIRCFIMGREEIDYADNYLTNTQPRPLQALVRWRASVDQWLASRRTQTNGTTNKITRFITI
jgi:hypothetical protein